MELQHGCRAAYGPLELQIQTTASENGFTVYVADPRVASATVYEQTIQGTLDSAKEYVILRAHEYLNSFAEAARQEASWRCS